LSRFDFALKHVAGKSMGRADSLSRRVDWVEGVEKDNENQVMLKKEWLEVRVLEQLIEGPEEGIVKKIKKARDKDEEVIKVVEEMEKAEGFVREMKERHEEARAALVRSQEEIKRQTNRSRKEAEEYRVGDKVLISTKDFSMELMKRVTKKLMEKFIGPYMVKKIVSENAVELELPASLRIHLVVNVRRIVKYRK